MMLEAVWFKNGKEVYKVSPVLNIVCEYNMKSIADIEIENEFGWCSCTDFEIEADDFMIRIKKD